MSRLLNPSGGLAYHVKALCFADREWLPFRKAVAEFVLARLPGGDELVLIGPSAGHCLPLELIARYRRIIALEPDPVARALLQWRTGHALEFEARDLLVAPLLSGAAGLDDVLARRPDSAVLFCNVLGQLQFELSDKAQARFQSAFRACIACRLQGRNWASFHDRFSLAAHLTSPTKPLHFRRLPGDEDVARALFGADGHVTLLDHGTTPLFPSELPRSYVCWQLTPRSLHVIEMVGS